MDELDTIIANAPDNFVIRNALVKCYDYTRAYMDYRNKRKAECKNAKEKQ